ncbi:MAG: indolepyruvate oxidoreductase subunit beta [Spirochaetes bacterium]|nr:indolepyruvate oxidoreductase subunit beta [Spirochaetota bacterium]
MDEVKSILLAGVGGQGTILVSKVLTQGLCDAGFDVKMSEVHGMAQRGGSVSTQVRWGTKVHSPIIGRGGADILVAFEELEALRYAPFLKPSGTLVINRYEILPLPVSSGYETYPQGIVEALQAKFRTIVVDAASIAGRIGNAKTMNVVLLGAMVGAFGMGGIDWERALRAQIPENAMEANLAAFRVGREAAIHPS